MGTFEINFLLLFYFCNSFCIWLNGGFLEMILIYCFFSFILLWTYFTQTLTFRRCIFWDPDLPKWLVKTVCKSPIVVRVCLRKSVTSSFVKGRVKHSGYNKTKVLVSGNFLLTSGYKKFLYYIFRKIFPLFSLGWCIFFSMILVLKKLFFKF